KRFSSRVATQAVVNHVNSTKDGIVASLVPRNALMDIRNKTLPKRILQKAKRMAVKKVESMKKCQSESILQKEPSNEDVPKVQQMLPSQMETSVDVSEVLCQAFSDAMLPIEDVDINDGNNPFLCSEYIKDIYSYLRQLEAEQAVRHHYLAGQRITGGMRAILIDWLVQVQIKFKLLQETMYLTVSILDQFLQNNLVTAKRLQLVGVTAMLVASKYEEMYPPEIGDFVFVTDNSYTGVQVREMERRILKRLNFSLCRPIPLHFLRRAAKVTDVSAEQHILAKYLMELTMGDYDMVHYPPSLIAAAGFHLAQTLLSCGEWSPLLRHYMGYEEDELVQVMQHMAKNVVQVNNRITKHMSVKHKYAGSDQLRISTISQLTSPTILNLSQSLLYLKHQFS
uniref:Cyclin B1 n=1 Tax=Callorhinchus milii TaxID=7868 RepID=A0A4W3KFR7_CALMI